MATQTITETVEVLRRYAEKAMAQAVSYDLAELDKQNPNHGETTADRLWDDVRALRVASCLVRHTPEAASSAQE